MKIVLAAVALVVSALIVAAAFLLIPPQSTSEPAADPVPVRFMPTVQLERELAPRSGMVRGPALIPVPAGVTCRAFSSQALRRDVIVCR